MQNQSSDDFSEYKSKYAQLVSQDPTWSRLRRRYGRYARRVRFKDTRKYLRLEAAIPTQLRHPNPHYAAAMAENQLVLTTPLCPVTYAFSSWNGNDSPGDVIVGSHMISVIRNPGGVLCFGVHQERAGKALTFPGGKMELGDTTVYDTLQRELFEEGVSSPEALQDIVLPSFCSIDAVGKAKCFAFVTHVRIPEVTYYSLGHLEYIDAAPWVYRVIKAYLTLIAEGVLKAPTLHLN